MAVSGFAFDVSPSAPASVIQITPTFRQSPPATVNQGGHELAVK